MQDFETVFQQNKALIFRFLMKLCGDAALAEELTQETFFRAYMNFSGLRDEKKTAAWLCQIAKHAYFAWYNQQKKHMLLVQPAVTDSTPDIAQFFEEKELAGKAFACLHTLEEPYKEVFMLAVFGGLPMKQISELFCKSESWARVTFYRAKQKIKEGMAR